MFQKRYVSLAIGALLMVACAFAYAVWQYTQPVFQQGGQGDNIPSYKAPLTFSSSVPTEERASLKAQYAAVQAALDATTTDINTWIALGVVYKEAENYQDAEKVWQYTAWRWPFEIVSFNNLGDLYMNYLKNYPKAEANYKRFVEIDPKNINGYENLFNLYKYFYKTDTTAAADILAQGLKANPGNAYLLQLETQLREEK